MSLITGSNALVLWQAVVHEAEAHRAITLKHDLEAYLVMLLTRFTTKPDIFKKIISIDFFNSLDKQRHARELGLQEVGDTCLIFSGLFPGIAEKRMVKISYFTGIGSSAYGAMSKSNNDLFGLLSQQFVTLMDILQTVRLYSKKVPDLTPLDAYDLWNETHSVRAYDVLMQHTQASPVQSSVKNLPDRRFSIKK